MNLLDTIRNNSQAMQKPQGVTDQTQQLGTLLRAKTGKSVGGSAVGPSNLGEQQAVVQTNQTLQNEVAPQAAVQQAGLQAQQAGQQQSFNAQQQDITQNRKFDNIQTQMKTNSLLQDLEQSKGKVDAAQYQANVEQLGTNLRLQNQQYVDNLKREGDRARLDDENTFKEQMTATTFDNAQVILQDNLHNKSILDASDDDFHKAVSAMGVDDAYAMMRAQMQASDTAGFYQAAGAAAQSGIGAYGSYANKQDKQAGAK